jgi:hypothetical protein
LETWIDSSQTEEEDDGMNDENMQGDLKMYGKEQVTSINTSEILGTWIDPSQAEEDDDGMDDGNMQGDLKMYGKGQHFEKKSTYFGSHFEDIKLLTVWTF